MIAIGLPPDTMVELARLGASGISVLAIFTIGGLLWAYRKGGPETQKNLRIFMGACIIIAIISSITGVVTARVDANRTSELEAEKETLEAEKRNLLEEMSRLEIKASKELEAEKRSLLEEISRLEIKASKELEAEKRSLSEKISQLEIEASRLRTVVNQLQPPISVLAHPSANVKPNGVVCLNLTWTWRINSDEIMYIWSAEEGSFKPSQHTKLTQAKWIAPGDIPPTTTRLIRIDVVAIDPITNEVVGRGKPIKIAIKGLGTIGQHGVSQGNC